MIAPRASCTPASEADGVAPDTNSATPDTDNAVPEAVSAVPDTNNTTPEAVSASPCAGCTVPEADNAASGADNAAPTRSVQLRASRIAADRAPLRAVFMGTPEFAAVILEAMLHSAQVDIVAVYTQPDRPAGRGKKLTPPPVKELALRHTLPVVQPLSFAPGHEGDAAFAALAALAPDVLLVAAYGLILPQRVLDIPRLMPLNVHTSLLPRYRGAAPIQRAIMAGDAVTGVTIMRMEAGLDSGPILMQRAVGIDINDTSASLHDELAREGAELLELTLERLRAGVLAPIPQDAARATTAPKLRKEESRLDFSLPCRLLHARIRGLTPWPGAVMMLQREGQPPLTVTADPGRYPLTPAMRAAVEAKAPGATPGALLGLVDKALLVACGDGAYAFTRLRPAGGKSMEAAAFYNGYLAGASEARFITPPAADSTT